MVTEEVLPSRLKVVTEEIPAAPSIGIAIFIHTGSAYETEANNGVSHLLEHLLFKGARRNGRAISGLIEGTGGDIDAFTDKEHSCLVCRVPYQHTALALRGLAEMLVYPRFQPRAIETERAVLIDEIRGYRDVPEQKTMEMVDQLMWEGTSFGLPVTGTEESIRALSREQILAHWGDHYTADNMVLSVAGNISHVQVLEVVVPYFDHLPTRGLGLRLPAAVPLANDGPRWAIEFRETPLAYLCIALPAYPYMSPYRHALRLLSTILGSGMNSRLFREIVTRRGLGYEVWTIAEGFSQTGCLKTYASVDPAKLPELLAVICRHLRALKKEEAVSRQELERAKAYYLGSIQLKLENTLQRALWLGEAALHLGQVMAFEEFVDVISSVDLAMLQQVANEVIQASAVCLALIGPIDPSLREKVQLHV